MCKSVFICQDSQREFNTGIAYLNKPEGYIQQRTLCVLGPPRSGTSMVARSLAFMGIPMGVPVPAPSALVNYEDPEFVDILHCRSESEVDRNALGLAIQNRNGAYHTWGFKVPMAIAASKLLSSMLRNPHFVFVFRDPLSIAIRENLAVNAPVIDSIQRVIDYYSSMQVLLREVTAPCLLISYEKAIQSPSHFCRELAGFCGIPIVAEQLELWIQQTKPNHPEYLGRVVEARKELGLDVL